MRLLRDDWLAVFEKTRRYDQTLRRLGQKLDRAAEAMEADYRAAEILMSISETIVLPSSIMMDLIHNIKRIDTIGWIRLPYPYITVQFTHPILEQDIMPHIEINDLQKAGVIKNDYVLGLVIGNADQDTRPFPPDHVFNMMNCCTLFSSTSVNRVVWRGTNRPAEPDWEAATFTKNDTPPEHLENKMRMIALCYAINLFLNAPNVIIKRQKPDPKVQKNREKKGKRILPEYHTVTIEKVQVQYEESNKGSGKAHDHFYPVRGHFRKLKQFENPIWIHNHFRGLAHRDKPSSKSIYRLSPKEKDSGMETAEGI